MAAVEFDVPSDGIARLTLNRPEVLNAIDGALLDGLDEALERLDSGEYRVAVLTGAVRGFCAGADLSGTGRAWTKPAGAPFKTTYDTATFASRPKRPGSDRCSSRPGSPRWTWAPAICCRGSSVPAWPAS